jgi:hypothetical protein
VWIEKFDHSVCAARKAVVPAVVETDGQDGTFVNGHFHNASVGNVHLTHSIWLWIFNRSFFCSAAAEAAASSSKQAAALQALQQAKLSILVVYSYYKSIPHHCTIPGSSTIIVKKGEIRNSWNQGGRER